MLYAAPSAAKPEKQLPSMIVRPLVDHHKHLISPEAARGAYPGTLPEVKLPQELAELLLKRQLAWNNPAELEGLYTQNATVLNTENEDLPSWLRGRSAVAKYVGTLFGKPHRIKPVAYGLEGSRGHIAGYLYRPENDRHFGHVLLSVVRGSTSQWQIEAETPTFPGPRTMAEVDAKALVDQLDEAGINRAVVLSVAYWFGSDFRGLEDEQEHALVRAENDWVANQAALFPGRLISVCSVNPLATYALQEVKRCGEQGRHRGLKLHLGNSRVDLRQPEHAAVVGRVFAEANRQKLAIIIHLWTDPSFETDGAAHVAPFLENVLPNVPDVPVQIAHMAGGGRATHSALKVLAEAVGRNDPHTRNLFFDVATLVDGETSDNLRLNVVRMRQVGLERILFGSDTRVPSLQSWASLRALPLTDEEFRTIAKNVAPYAK
jgi:predicted TIM-barrel fold metal-dependent hydrolase